MKRNFHVLCLVGLALFLAPTISPASAQEGGPSPIVVVADFSGSMNQADADAQGTTRVAAAKSAVRTLLEQTPAEAPLGLVVYGANNDDCGDIQTLNPVGSFDAAGLAATVDGLNAVGNTPIGGALRHAADELNKAGGGGAIVLVSDGEPTCEPPPACDVAKELAASGVDLAVHTIGFRISSNNAAQDTLRCIADATGGEFLTVDSAEELAEELSRVSNRARAGYEVAGEEVSGGDSEAQASEISAGQYVLKLPVGATEWVSVPRPEGFDVLVGAVLVPPEGSGGGLQSGVKITRPSGPMGCAEREQWDTGYARMMGGEEDVQALLEMPAFDRPESCPDDHRSPISIASFGESWNEDATVELQVTYVRAADDVSTSTSDASVPEPGEPVELAGGTGFNDATVLSPGQTISDNARGGERRYFAVPVDYGQRLTVRLDYEPKDSAEGLKIHAFNPARQALPFVQDGSTMTELGGRGDSSVGAPLAEAFSPKFLVDPDASGIDSIRPFGLAGHQFITVTRSVANAESVPFRLTVNVVGEAQQSATEVITDAAALEAALSAEPPSPSQAPSSPNETSASESETQPSAPQETTAPSQPVTDEASPLPWILGTAGVTLVIVGAIWAFTRRRD